MTARFYGWNKDDKDATVSAASTGKNIELTVQDGVTGTTKRDIVEDAMVRIQQAILKDQATAYP